MNESSKAWYMKYCPKNIDEFIFENEKTKEIIKKWFEDERIDGNVIFYGKYGTGKTAISNILIRKIIKNSSDLFISRERSTKEFREKLIPFLSKKPISSNQKIVYIEEIDKLHNDAFNILKTELMEKFQNEVSFIGCTNYVKKIEPAVLSRFNYKISFNTLNKDDVLNRVIFILNNEGAVFDNKKVEEFISNNINRGFREILNILQKEYIQNNKEIKLESLKTADSLEERIIELILNMFKSILVIPPKDRKICLISPENSKIQEEYKEFLSIIHNNFDIEYDYIYNRIYDSINFIPLKMICGKYMDQQEYKKIPQLNLIGFFYESTKCIVEIGRI